MTCPLTVFLSPKKMAFWGVEIKSGCPFTLQSVNQNGRLHISQATLGNGSSPKKSLLQCNVGNNAPVLLCSLLPEKMESCPINLEFEEEEDVVFSVLGSKSIHLSGYHVGPNHARDEDESDSYGEDIGIETETDEESSHHGSEDQYEDDFIDDDDAEVFDVSHQVKIENIIDDEQPRKDTDGPKLLNLQTNANAGRRRLVLEDSDSEVEDGLSISTGSRKKHSKVDEAKANLDEHPEEGKNVGKHKEDENSHVIGSKRKSGALGQDGDNKNYVDREEDPSETTGLENSGKAKKKKRKGLKKQELPEFEADMLRTASGKASDAQPERKKGPASENVEHDNAGLKVTAKNLSFSDSANHNVTEVQEVKKKKKEKKEKNLETDKSPEKSKLANTGGKELENLSSVDNHADEQTIEGLRAFPNGLVIEEIFMGKPDGKHASPGSKVSVRYTGKLKKDGSIFYSSVGQKPFKFRLGMGKVIKGWDVGINGMRVGDKRRLTIPPSMGYGSSGAGKIPGNAWLVFDVELVNVH